jgi:hypothetical protein
MTRAQLFEINGPDALPKKTWRREKTHGKANARGLTGPELVALERSE